MGYYTGSGVVVSGGESYSVLRTFAILGGGSFKVSQKNSFTVTKRAGISLQDAQAVHESHDLSYTSGGSGNYAWIVFDANGTRSTPSYSRIADSSLYELTVLNEDLTAYKEEA